MFCGAGCWRTARAAHGPRAGAPAVERLAALWGVKGAVEERMEKLGCDADVSKSPQLSPRAVT